MNNDYNSFSHNILKTLKKTISIRTYRGSSFLELAFHFAVFKLFVKLWGNV